MSMIGKTLSHYSLSALLGKGGMGEVYKAKDQKLGRDVAIKVLPEEFAKDADHAAGAVDILHVVLLGRWRDLAQVRHAPGQLIDLLEAEIHTSFVRGCQQVQDGVGGTSHGDVHRHRVAEGFI